MPALVAVMVSCALTLGEPRMLREGTNRAPQVETQACATPKRESPAPPTTIHEGADRAVNQWIIVSQRNREAAGSAAKQSAPNECNRLHWTVLGAVIGGSIAAVPAYLVAKRFNNEGADGLARAGAGAIIGAGALLGGLMGLNKCP